MAFGHRVWHRSSIDPDHAPTVGVSRARPALQCGSGANHPAQRMPTFLPRLAETAKLRPFEMPNSAPSHNHVPVPAHVVLKYGTQCSCRSVPYTRPTYLVTRRAGKRSDVMSNHYGAAGQAPLARQVAGR